MDRNKKSIDIVIDLLKQNNIRYFVISPGGTNIPLVKKIQDDKDFICYSVVDERSAIYVAIGIYLQTGEIVATSCTSAQATRNYIPGLTEAFYKRVPILALTMAKHPRFTFQEYMQAPDQTSLPDDCVKSSYALPFLRDENDELHCIRLVNQAIQELTHNRKGPVQLCIPWLDFPLGKIDPAVRKISIFSNEDAWNFNFQNRKLLIVIGEHRPFSKQETSVIDEFCATWNCAVYVNHLSNFHGEYAIYGNLFLSTITIEDFCKEYAPDIFITIGGQTGDYPLYKMLSSPALKSVEHWRVSNDGEIIDTYDKLTSVFQISEQTFFSRMMGTAVCEHSYFLKWKDAVDEKRRDMALPLSNGLIAQYMCSRIPKNSTIQFSILNSLRIWNLFNIDPSVACYSNVGAFGIDGGMSTLIGQSIVTDNLCYMIVGDLAFYYDMNAIAIRHIRNNLRIILINNNGGMEFKYAGQDYSNVNRFIAAGGHFHNARGWSESCGFSYYGISKEQDFTDSAHVLFEPSEKPILFEIFVSEDDEAQAYGKLIETNSKKTFEKNIKKSFKSVVRGMLGDQVVEKIKSHIDK